MTTWARIDSDGNAHPLTQAQDKKARQKYSRLIDTTKMRADDSSEGIDEEPDHITVGQLRRDSTQVRLIGLARDLHGPEGVCTCCHGRRP